MTLSTVSVIVSPIMVIVDPHTGHTNVKKSFSSCVDSLIAVPIGNSAGQ